MWGSTAVTLDAVASCEAQGYMNRSHQTGRYRSGQTGQTVNLLALRLRWFESSPAQFPHGHGASAVLRVGDQSAARANPLEADSTARMWRQCVLSNNRL